MSEQKNKSFLDSNTLLALILTFIIFIGWQQYVNYKYPPKKKEIAEKTQTEKTSEEEATGVSIEDKIEIVQPSESLEKKILNFEDDYWKFEISSAGMSLENVVIKKINKVAKNPYEYNFTKVFYPTYINGKKVDFTLSKESEKKFLGVAFVEGHKVYKEIEMDSSHYVAQVKIYFDKKPSQPFKIEHKMDVHIEDPKKVVFFLPAFDRTELYFSSQKESEREILVTKTEMEEPEQQNASTLVSISDHYFAAAFLNTGKVLPNFSYIQKKKDLELNTGYNFDQNLESKEVSFDLFIGPKKVGMLAEVSPELSNIVNFSYLGFIARPILKLLNIFYSFLGNYGLAVIALTLLIRILIMPLAVSSFKSMKRMQTIQPRLKKIKEKYKDQPQVANQKTMELMRQEKVNPLGGCLPMFLQLPIFFAFYRGLSESVELYQAPFFGWIQDLSKMDPYFVFPVLAIAGMLIHQLMTPSTMDKMQRRMMLAMPVFFGLFFISLPSALSIYMTVSTWFGIIQHAIFLREKKS